MQIELSPHVADFIRTLAPEPHRLVRSALRKLAQGQGDILELEHPLDGFCRLKCGRYRIVFHYARVGGRTVIRCDYAQRRELVYERFADRAAEMMIQLPDCADGHPSRRGQRPGLPRGTGRDQP